MESINTIYGWAVLGTSCLVLEFLIRKHNLLVLGLCALLGALLAAQSVAFPLQIASFAGSSLILLTVPWIRRRLLQQRPLPALPVPLEAGGESVTVSRRQSDGTLGIIHHATWRPIWLIDPQDPPLQPGESVYLVEVRKRVALVSRVKCRP
ncbi:hypothetical protein GCM10027040_32670 [Halomonas shantousis]